jgi:hypothetical protein
MHAICPPISSSFSFMEQCVTKLLGVQSGSARVGVRSISLKRFTTQCKLFTILLQHGRES